MTQRGHCCLSRSLVLLVLFGLAACSTSRPGGNPSEWGRGDYSAPGPATDPWGPYIRQAAARFAVPEQWIRAVMMQESGGKQYHNGRLTTSGSGAMGLMQLMPSTWSELAANYGLGNDPYEPHDNIMAGAGYIRDLYGKFGSPGFLAAYNAGPGRLEQYLETGTPLPDETVNYVASIGPHLGDSVPAAVPADVVAPIQVAQATAPSRPFAAPAGAAPLTRTADGCLRNADAAYDPHDCLMDRDTPHPDPAPQPVPPQAPALAPPVMVASARVSPAQPLPRELASYVEPGTAAAPMAARPIATTGFGPVARGAWAVQVGAFSSNGEARQALAQAQALIGAPLGRFGAVVSRVSTAPSSLYRARLIGFAAQDASSACQLLHSHAMACFTVPIAT